MIISFIQSLESFSNCIKQFVSSGIKCSNGIKGWKSRKMFDGRLNLSKKRMGKSRIFVSGRKRDIDQMQKKTDEMKYFGVKIGKVFKTMESFHQVIKGIHNYSLHLKLYVVVCFMFNIFVFTSFAFIHRFSSFSINSYRDKLRPLMSKQFLSSVSICN